MPFGLVESGLGLGADTLAMLGSIVGDLAQSGVRGGQRLPQRTIAPFNACLPIARVDATCGTPAATHKIERKNHHDYDDDDADRDRQPVPL